MSVTAFLQRTASAPPRAARRIEWAGRLRQALLGISEREVTLERRGVRPVSPAAGRRLETIGQTFLRGYHAGLESSECQALAAALDDAPNELRGFAYEGAAMALYLLDRLTPWRRNRFDEFLAGPGAAHVYMMHVGVGWAVAALRRRLARALAALHPVLRWLAVDGYGFHEAFFRPQRALRRQQVPRWMTGYTRRAFDQGLGRGLWFAEGADVDRIDATILAFDVRRRADLWSGVGLAATYAGGVGDEALRTLAAKSGRYRPDLAQGAAFAAKARQRADNMAEHTDLACRIVCEMPAELAARITDEELVGCVDEGGVPAYEAWRRKIQARIGRRNLTATA